MTNPDLVNITTLSAYDLSSVYTVSDIEEIIAYGNRLGIDVIFESAYILSETLCPKLDIADAAVWL